MLAKKHITNPILRGFNPDPSICRVNDDFYVATSTFEWFPGVQIWHSRNLSEWTLIRRPLDSTRLLDLAGIESSGGVWAPCLTYSRGIFHLVFTVVRKWRGERPVDFGAFKDTPNFLTCAASVEGPWSDPVYLNSSGFDPSLFHDEGRIWLLNMEWDYRGTPNFFTGILLQELDSPSLRPKGPIRRIFTGTSLGRVEGPHLYKRNGWYYLVVAEGGTEYEHAVTVARSRNITGPYEIHPNNPILTSLENPVDDLRRIADLRSGSVGSPPGGFYGRPQKAGHASLCLLDDEDWVLVHLSGRPVPGSAACPLGRETSMQRVLWFDDWPRVVDADNRPVPHPQATVQFPKLKVPLDVNPPTGRELEGKKLWRNTDMIIEDDFTGSALHPAFRFLRRDPADDVRLDIGNCCLELIGRESPVSTFRQTVVAVSAGAFHYSAETCLEFAPDSFQQMAGLMVRYDERNQYYLRIAGGGAEGGRTLGVIRFAAGRFDMPIKPEIVLAPGPVSLRVEVDAARGCFFWRQNDWADWNRLNVDLNMLQLSDEETWPQGFTGTFVGMACHDMTGRGWISRFFRFRYEET